MPAGRVRLLLVHLDVGAGAGAETLSDGGREGAKEALESEPGVRAQVRLEDGARRPARKRKAPTRLL